MSAESNKPLGLIAGGGFLPTMIAATARAMGRPCIIASFSNTDDETLAGASEHKKFGVGHLQSIIDYLSAHNVSEVALAGQVNHSELFKDRDFDALMIEAINHPDNRAEAVLGRIADIIERKLAPVASIIEILKDNVIKTGDFHRAEISERQRADFDFGWKIGSQLAPFNIGQTIMVRSGVVVAVEAVEGTDEMLRRMQPFGIRNGTVVKLPLQNKDPRFDVPIVGPQTIESMLAAGASALLVAAYETILVDPEKLKSLCSEHSISIIAREFSLE